jgi:hypothetical protein
VQVLALFANGRIEQWLECICLSPTDMCDPKLIPRIARHLRRFHSIQVSHTCSCSDSYSAVAVTVTGAVAVAGASTTYRYRLAGSCTGSCSYIYCCSDSCCCSGRRFHSIQLQSHWKWQWQWQQLALAVAAAMACASTGMVRSHRQSQVKSLPLSLSGCGRALQQHTGTGTPLL